MILVWVGGRSQECSFVNGSCIAVTSCVHRTRAGQVPGRRETMFRRPRDETPAYDASRVDAAAPGKNSAVPVFSH